MKRIGLISDTHGTFDDTLRGFLTDVDEIWHAGDIGSLELADRIAAFKPLRAVCGNTDGGTMRRVWPLVDFFRCEEATVLMTHIGGYPRRYDPRILPRIRSARPTLFGTLPHPADHLRSGLPTAPPQPRRSGKLRHPQSPHGAAFRRRRRRGARHGDRRVAPEHGSASLNSGFRSRFVAKKFPPHNCGGSVKRMDVI